MILDGKSISSQIKEELKKELLEIKNKTGLVPGFAIIMVGENPASKIYVNSKIKGCKEIGIECFPHFLPEDVSEKKLLETIDELNKDPNIDGMLVQLPLPKHIEESKVIQKIALEKDVDGFKPENLGLLFLGNKTSLKPCTPLGIMELLKKYSIELQGKDVTIIGRSNIVGKPMAGFFINAGATVTVCNSKTKNLKEKTKNADILVVAIGVAKFITEDMVKNGAVVIDVGINRTADGLFGDVDFKEVEKKASYITPVPGGVGPMTVAMLFHNTVQAFKNNRGI
ncbi:bifunctional methylenetetrahydrofolate dehydrogenase/methenyltetrahydrofolate cyclohydrolase FolD [Fusobacterium varium]|uniref:bifunctional methylenetetrahydrofolate dehydrogenase/methenyltetrahydrofolate cyclohydrolase FolD n=1 Tax=Fusobacterium varium TaxID=856 RepID=UPI001F17EF03|nr:bifunctional methylenetetrahydrofolate dehydrogenase/methenyltetrahydrofolate cyclohydrolase FolD [Fusobacterium varium]MCF2672857.1 bifunctional methylenetetrahydrofolate dehydrogenase/methenyltetrahydrofolate cyclohydrolase FolD [Fusobacterium varium]